MQIAEILKLIARLESWQAARDRINTQPQQTKHLDSSPLKQAVVGLRELIQLKENKVTKLPID